MSVTKEEIVKILNEIAVLLELTGEEPFKARAYEKAARNLERTTENIHELVEQGQLSRIPGIGAAIEKKIRELITSGKLAYYERLKASVPPGHLEMLKIPQLGPKKIRTLYEALGITSIGELEYACRENRLLGLPGFGAKTQENILRGIERVKHYQARRLYIEAMESARSLLSALKDESFISLSLAGSLRRGAETVKDIDLLVATRHPHRVSEIFTATEPIETVIAQGETKVSVVLKTGINCDLRIVSPEEFPYALHHFTGSREHNTAMRGRAKERGIKMNEYGLFRREQIIRCTTEEEIFAALGLRYIPPELRENMGEIEAAERGELPALIDKEDIKGLLHFHTNYSDGSNSIEELARYAMDLGYTYIGIADHSQSAYYAGGVKPEDVRQQWGEIDDLNKRFAPFHIFKGIESDILPDGRLDYSDDVLSSFDFVIAAVHSHFRMKNDEMTERILTALRNPFTTMLAHPTGRLLLSREPYEVNITAVISEAASYGKAIELNAHPYRLDLSWQNCIHAKKRGVKIAINPDLHDLNGFQHVELGVKMARKGWLERGDCLNCLTVGEISELFQRIRLSR